MLIISKDSVFTLLVLKTDFPQCLLLNSKGHIKKTICEVIIYAYK